MKPDNVLAAMRADAIPAGESGRWTVSKWAISRPLEVPRNNGKSITIAAGSYTNLHCLTEATMHKPPGELVMHDEPHDEKTELQGAWEFPRMFRAIGRARGEFI